MKKLNLFFAALLVSLIGLSQGYKIGDVVEDFKLKNVDGSHVSMSNHPEAKGFILIFSCNHCPFVVAYEDRMIEYHNKFAPIGFPIIAINSNDPEVQPLDSFEKMQERSDEKGFPFAYVFDEGQKVYPRFGATRTPEVYLVQRVPEGLKLVYTGAIDDNHRDASNVEEHYLANAIHAILEGKIPNPDTTRAIGCTIKVKN
jgi:peroxiredoxin